MTDEEVFGAAYRVMNRLGPSDWTLADIAREAGVTASALVQRYGSKRELMLALMAAFAASSGDLFAQLRSAHSSPLAVLHAYGACMASMGATPQMLSHHLSYLQLDLTDPDYHRHFRAQAEGTRAALRDLLREAAARGELKAQDATFEEMARALEVTITGSLLRWGSYQEGSAADAMRHDLTFLLERWRDEGNS